MHRSPKRAAVLTIINLKGGVGKTHASWLLASVCQQRGRRVLLIDLDTQANITGSFMDEDDGQPRVDALFHPGADANPLPLVRRTRYEHIDVIPSSAALARYDESNQKTWERADLHLSLVDAVEALRPEYDFIVFDCPPRLSLVSFAALCASDHVIIPMEAADWGAQGIMQVTEAIRYVQQRFNAKLNLLGYLVSRFKRARAYQQTYLAQLRKHFGALAFDTVLPDLAQFEKSVTDRIPITLHAPASEEAAIARRFFDEIDRRVQERSGGHARRTAHVRRRAVAAA